MRSGDDGGISVKRNRTDVCERAYVPYTALRGPHILNAGSGRHHPRGRGNLCCASRHAVTGSYNRRKDKCPELRSCLVEMDLISK
jgi:hypothetical protein